MIRRENLRTGFRRLSIVTGILGAMIGWWIGEMETSRFEPFIVFCAMAGAFIGWGVAFAPYWVVLGFLGDGVKKPQRDDEVV